MLNYNNRQISRGRYALDEASPPPPTDYYYGAKDTISEATPNPQVTAAAAAAPAATEWAAPAIGAAGQTAAAIANGLASKYATDAMVQTAEDQRGLGDRMHGEKMAFTERSAQDQDKQFGLDAQLSSRASGIRNNFIQDDLERYSRKGIADTLARAYLTRNR